MHRHTTPPRNQKRALRRRAFVLSIAALFAAAGGVGNGYAYLSTVNVSGMTGTVTDVNVTINGLTHTWPEELGLLLTLREFQPDVKRIGQNVVVGAASWEAQLEANKVAYFDEFVSRSAFTTAYPASLTAAQFVDALNANAGGALSTTERNQLVSELAAGTKTRAQVLRAVAEDSDFASAQFNRAFVLMEYFGYLRRNPNDTPDADFTGYNFWLGKLNSFGGDYVNAELVKAFITSLEYRQRFGQQ